MASWQEAFLILKKWRDEHSPLEYSDVIVDGGATSQGEPIAIGHGLRPVRVVDVSPGVLKFRFEGGGPPDVRELELIGASFEYWGPSESPFPEFPAEEYVCFLEITRPDGRLVVFSERLKEFGE